MNSPAAAMSWPATALRALPRLRLGLAAFAIAACMLAGMQTRCGDMIGTDLVALVAMAAIQGATALVSFVRTVIAGVRRDFAGVAVEAVVCLAMLLVVPLALCVLVGSMSECLERTRGG